MPLPRICQFFLRGRCQRGEKCDFSHVMPTNASSATATTANGSSNKIVQSNNSSSMKTASPFAGEKEPFIAPKVSTLVDVFYCSEFYIKILMNNKIFIKTICLNSRCLCLIIKVIQTVTTSPS